VRLLDGVEIIRVDPSVSEHNGPRSPHPERSFVNYKDVRAAAPHVPSHTRAAVAAKGGRNVNQ
jgi:hypothetical protein